MKLNLNKSYFSLRPKVSPLTKIPAIDAKKGYLRTEEFVWNKTGPLIQSPYEDYNLNFMYWEDESWNAAKRINNELSGNNTLKEISWLDYSFDNSPLLKDMSVENKKELKELIVDTSLSSSIDEPPK
jgi:hypothetical protein